MEKIILKLNKEEFPNVISIYRKQAAQIAVKMCQSQNMEIQKLTAIAYC